LLHGFPEFWYGWRHQIQPLAQAGYRVIAPDQRGYNLSDKPGGISAYRMDVLARDVTGLLDALGYERANLVGHNWGGIIAWVAAALYPGHVSKLAVLNAPFPAVGLKTLLRDPGQLRRSSYIAFFQPPLLPEAMMRANNWDLLVRTLQQSSRPGTFTPEDLDRYRQAWWRKGAIKSMLNWYRAFVRRPIRLPRGRCIQAPTLILWGTHDTALGRRLAEDSLKHCSNGKLLYFEDATHWLQDEEPQAVNQQLLSFLSQEP
jgi:pimeloyl-ACP methyl ester carboxylesterase